MRKFLICLSFAIVGCGPTKIGADAHGGDPGTGTGGTGKMVACDKSHTATSVDESGNQTIQITQFATVEGLAEDTLIETCREQTLNACLGRANCTESGSPMPKGTSCTISHRTLVGSVSVFSCQVETRYIPAPPTNQMPSSYTTKASHRILN